MPQPDMGQRGRCDGQALAAELKREGGGGGGWRTLCLTRGLLAPLKHTSNSARPLYPALARLTYPHTHVPHTHRQKRAIDQRKIEYTAADTTSRLSGTTPKPPTASSTPIKPHFHPHPKTQGSYPDARLVAAQRFIPATALLQSSPRRWKTKPEREPTFAQESNAPPPAAV